MGTRQRLAHQLGQRCNPRHFLDQIGLAQHIGPPAWHPCHIPLKPEAQGLQRAALLRFGDVHPDQRNHPRRIQPVGAADIRHGTGDHRVRWFPAAQLHDHRRRIVQRLHVICRVNAAFIAIARIGIDFQTPSRHRDLDTVPHGGFQEHIGGFPGAARRQTAHDTAHGFHAVVIGNHHHAGGKGMFLFIQPYHGLAALGAVNGQPARHLARVKHMQGAVAVIGEEIRHIHQRRNGAQANRPQTRLQPFRRGAVFHALDQTAREHLAAVRGSIPGDGHGDGAGALAVNLRRLGGFHHAQTPRRQIQRDPAHAQRIGAVRCDGDFDHRVHLGGVVFGQPVDEQLPHFAAEQFDDAVVFFGQLQFAFRCHHAVAFHAANVAHA